MNKNELIAHIIQNNVLVIVRSEKEASDFVQMVYDCGFTWLSDVGPKQTYYYPKAEGLYYRIGNLYGGSEHHLTFGGLNYIKPKEKTIEYTELIKKLDEQEDKNA